MGSEGNGFGDVFKNLFKTVHNAALQAKIKKADEDYKKALGAYVASSLVLSAHHVALTLATAALNAAKALPVTGSAWAKMELDAAKKEYEQKKMKQQER